jgi:hypothetical protein
MRARKEIGRELMAIEFALAPDSLWGLDASALAALPRAVDIACRQAPSLLPHVGGACIRRGTPPVPST